MKGNGLWKKGMAWTLCLLMLLSLGACSKDIRQEKDTVNTGTAEDKYSRHMTFSIASIQINEAVDYNNEDEFTKWWREKYNFDWEVSSLTWDTWAEKLRIWINSGDMPDMATWNYIHGEFLNYVDQGLLYEFPDGWKERWPNVAKAYEDTGIGPRVEELVGGTYGLPKPVFSLNKPTEKVITHMATYIRKDWAQEVGFALKDYYKASEILEYARLLKANGISSAGNKLVPITVRPDNLITMFTSSNNAYANGMFYKGDDGKFHWGPADEATLAGLKLYKQAYEEGLLHPEFYTYSGTEDVEDFYVAGIGGVTILEGMAAAMENVELQFRQNLGMEYEDAVHSAFIVGEDGHYYWPESANYWTWTIFSPHISTEKFERYMDMMDYAASEEGQRFIRMGFEGVDWKYDTNGELVTLLEGETTNQKYKTIHPLYGNLVILSDDFSIINPVFKKVYRDRVQYFYKTKEALGTEKTIPSIDWDVTLYSSPAKDKLSYTWGTEYAELILKNGDMEANWRKWVEENAYLIDPVLQELNEAFGD